jgi:glycosyltransferase involved in cell wall biosynthesis
MALRQEDGATVAHDADSESGRQVPDTNVISDRPVLVVSPQPFFTPRGTPISVYHRTQVLAELGFEVDLLTYGEGADIDVPGVRVIRIPRFEFLGEVKVGPSMLKFFLDVLLFFWMVGLLLKRRYAFVYVHEEAVFLSLFLKPLFRFKLIYDMHSSLPQQLIRFQVADFRILVWLFRRLEAASLRYADAVVTVCPNLLSRIEAQVGKCSKHFLIENSITDEIALIKPEGWEEERLSSRPPQPDFPEGSRVIVYAGTLENYQGIDLLLSSFVNVREQVADAQLLIVGGRPAQVEKYAALGRRLGLDESCVFIGSVPYEQARHYCRMGDIQVASRLCGADTPLKVYEQIASGIPIVATNIKAHTHILNDDVAFLVAPDPESLAQGMTQALTDPEAARARARRAQDLYRTNYSRDIYVEKVRRLLDWISLDVRDRRDRQLR